MISFDELLQDRTPSMVVVAGDVNSTLACALVAAKRQIPVAHVEAGLRSRDRSMPEELNRMVTDVLSDILFATSPDAVANLEAEGIPPSWVHFVGNPMIDTLKRNLPLARARRTAERFALKAREYALVTLHRPSNVDEGPRLRTILEALDVLAGRIPVVFPAHPRTQACIERLEFHRRPEFQLLGPLGYLDFLGLMDTARLVITDSGGIQEETTALGVPCLTLRANTERPITLAAGTNQLLGTDPAAILPTAERVMANSSAPPARPPLWDGHAGVRIAKILAEWLTGMV